MFNNPGTLVLWYFGDWSLITGRGTTKQQMGTREVLPEQKGQGRKQGLAVLKGGGGFRKF